ncbi:MAG: hypothetical protein HY726_11915 [Candidatus Rokubacteria bacterium]|nr:hypothetical protein [Candidatus Rokubacteria bacterium]
MEKNTIYVALDDSKRKVVVAILPKPPHQLLDADAGRNILGRRSRGPDENA